jgi:hypothetical protein
MASAHIIDEDEDVASKLIDATRIINEASEMLKTLPELSGDSRELKFLRMAIYGLVQSQQNSQGPNAAFSKEVTCAICMELMNESCTLGCGHSFCKNCIKEVYNAERYHPSCPECRAAIEIPFERLKINTCIKNLVNRLQPAGRPIVPTSPPEAVRQQYLSSGTPYVTSAASAASDAAYAASSAAYYSSGAAAYDASPTGRAATYSAPHLYGPYAEYH